MSQCLSISGHALESPKLGQRVKAFKEENDSNNLTLWSSLGDSITKAWPEIERLSNIFAVTLFNCALVCCGQGWGAMKCVSCNANDIKTWKTLICHTYLCILLALQSSELEQFLFQYWQLCWFPLVAFETFSRSSLGCHKTGHLPSFHSPIPQQTSSSWWSRQMMGSLQVHCEVWRSSSLFLHLSTFHEERRLSPHGHLVSRQHHWMWGFGAHSFDVPPKGQK